jgi:hypothetical protein
MNSAGANGSGNGGGGGGGGAGPDLEMARTAYRLNIRVGVHVGPACGVVLGNDRPRFTLIGGEQTLMTLTCTLTVADFFVLC